MSSLGALTGHLERERQLLRSLNTALLALEAQAGRATGAFGFSERDVDESRNTLCAFVTSLREQLDHDIAASEFQALIERIKADSKPVTEWRDDLAQTCQQLRSRRELGEDAKATLEEIVLLLDQEFAEDLQRLRTR